NGLTLSNTSIGDALDIAISDGGSPATDLFLSAVKVNGDLTLDNRRLRNGTLDNVEVARSMWASNLSFDPASRSALFKAVKVGATACFGGPHVTTGLQFIDSTAADLQVIGASCQEIASPASEKVPVPYLDLSGTTVGHQLTL